MQIAFIVFQEVTDVSYRLGHANSNIECIYDWLAEILLHCFLMQHRQVDSMERRLIPEVRLIVLLRVERLVTEWRNMQVAVRREHFTVWLKPLPCVQICLEHALVEEHVAHRLGDDNVHHLRQFNFLYFPGDHHNFFLHVVRHNQLLRVLGHVARFDRIHLGGSGLYSKERKDSRPSANIQDNFILPGRKEMCQGTWEKVGIRQQLPNLRENPINSLR